MENDDFELPFKRLSGAVRIKHGGEVAESTSYAIQKSFTRRDKDRDPDFGGMGDQEGGFEEMDYRDRNLLIDQKRKSKYYSKQGTAYENRWR